MDVATYAAERQRVNVNREAPVVTVVGLTGGIATGKSTVTKMLRQLGARVIDADVIAREVVAPGTEGLAAIHETFGDEVLASDGTLNREALGRLVFADPAARARLNAITHPRIAMTMMQRAAEAGNEGLAWVIYDAALLVENGIHEMLPASIVVACSEDTQRRRLIARDGFTPAEAEARIDAQLPLAKKIAVADWVIDNDGTLAQTEAQVRAVFDELVRRFGPLPSRS